VSRRRGVLSLCLAILVLPLGWTVAGAQDVARAPATALAGVVRDEFGDPIAAVEVTLLGSRVGTRTDSSGRFELAGVPAGDHVVRFRRLGFTSVDVDWVAVANTRIEVSVRLEPLPQYLDPVVTYAKEADAPVGTAIISGVVVDSTGVPVPEAVVQLVGAGRTTMSAARGDFIFRRLPAGDYALLVRRLGFAPATVHLRLTGTDDRELTLRLRQLPARLDTVKVVESSGFGRLEGAYHDLEARQRWRGPMAVMLAGEELRSLGKMTLDLVLNFRASTGRPPPRIANAGSASTGESLITQDDVCMLLNGRTPRIVNLRYFAADQLDRIEIYPEGTELTGTVAARMESLPGCRPVGPRNPFYIVVWVKGSEREP